MPPPDVDVALVTLRPLIKVRRSLQILAKHPALSLSIDDFCIFYLNMPLSLRNVNKYAL